MKYFKNTELAKLYSVSEKSVRNWIDAATEGKLALQLYEEKGRTYVANTSKNTHVIEEQVEKGKKYRNSRGLKTVRPSPNFYKRYSLRQIFDIISNIDTYHEVPHQYSYFNGGAKHWDLYSKKLVEEGKSNSLTNTIQLLDLHMSYIDKLLEDFDEINIVDIGVGNALPVRGLLQHFLDAGKLNRYIGIDISHDMLKMAESNIQEWFRGGVTFEGHIKDINYDRFDELFIEDAYTQKANSQANVILFFGGTISNLREPSRALATIHDSMGKHDLFMLTKRLDTPKTRRYFDFSAEAGEPTLDLKEKSVLDLLNIDETFYSVEQTYNAETKSREIGVRLKIALRIEFELQGHIREIELNKDDRIILWRARHQNANETLNEFYAAGFDPVQGANSKDQEYLLLTSRIQTKDGSDY